MLRSWPLAEQRRFFEEELGVPLVLEPASGKLFPASNKARDVRDALVAAETSPAVQALYQRYSDEAEALGVFGAPTFVLNGERFWGQDRLDFVDRALDALRISGK